MNRKGVAELAGSVALGAWAAFGVLALVVSGRGGAPLFLDHGLLNWSVGHRTPVTQALARGLTDTGTGVVPYALVALAGLLAGRTRRRRVVAALFGVACLAVGQAARYGVMQLVARTRPPHEYWRTEASGWSFPSGHTTTSALTAGLVILALCVRMPRGRLPLCLAVGCWGAAVGLTRIFLGVHWFTDVLGGWLFAIGWLGTCLCAAAWWLPDRLIFGTDTGTGTDTGSVSGRGTSTGTGTGTGTDEPGPLPLTDSADAPLENHAPQDPGRRGRSRPA